MIDILGKGNIVYEYQTANGWIFTSYSGKCGWVPYYIDGIYYLEFMGGGIEKPALYLYPEEKTEVSVKLKLSTSELGTTYPKYNDGWSVTAYPDGSLVDKKGNHYDYLFWEAKKDRTVYDTSEGFVVKGSEAEEFLKEKLAILGLNENERNEFIVYWLPRLEENDYNLVTFQTDCYTEANELHINPKPDTVIRVFMTYKPLKEKIKVPEQRLKGTARKGFTVVEWGGAELPQ